MPNLTNPEIRYVEKTHQYFLGEKELPSITTILAKLGLTKNYDKVDPYFAERGSAVHAAIALDLADDLEESSLDPVLRPFLNAFRAFKREKGFKVLECEKIVYSEELGYAGRIDWYGKIGDESWLIDGKCTKKHDSAADFQLCGQAYAIEEAPDHLAILELHDDGTYNLCEYAKERFALVWLAVMELFKRRFK